MSSQETHSPSTGYNGDPFNKPRTSTEWEVADQKISDYPPQEIDRREPSWWLKMRTKIAAGALTLTALVGGGIAYNALSDADAETVPDNERVTEQVVEPTEEEVPLASDIDTLADYTIQDYPFNGFNGQPYSSFDQQVGAWQITDEEQIGQSLVSAINQIANYTPSEDEYYNMGVHAIAASSPNAIAEVNNNWKEDGAGIFGEEYLAPFVSEAFIEPTPGTDIYVEDVDIVGPMTQFIAETQEKKYRNPDYEAHIEILHTTNLSGLQSLGTTGIGTETWVKYTDNDPDTEDTYQILRTSAHTSEDGVIRLHDTSYQEETKEQLQIYADQQNLTINW